MNGPRLTDEAFFEAMNLDLPELAEVKESIRFGDITGAKRKFVTHLRRRDRPLWFADWRDRSDPSPRHEVELVRVGEDAIQNVDLRFADTVARNTLKSCSVEQVFGDTVNWELNPIDYKEWTWQLSRHPFWVTLGQAYWKTGDEKYAEAFVRQIVHWIGNVLVPVDEDGNGWKDDAEMGTDRTNCWRTIECGIRMGQTWPYAFHYFLSSPAFSDEAVVMVVKSMVEHARHLMRWPRSGNWLTMEANGMYHVGVLFPEFREAAEWRRVAMERLYKELDVQVYPDGAQIELSSGYHQVSLRNFVMAYNLARLNQEPVPEDYVRKLERMYEYDLYLAMPDLRMPALNDGGWTDVRPWMQNALEFFPHREDFRWAATEGHEGSRPTRLSTAFPYAGHFVMRTGWDHDDRYLFFDGGPFGYGHQHEDKLNVVIYAHGRVHATDPGNYPYDSSRWRAYVLSTRAHNTVMVDGLEQNQRGKSRDAYVVKDPLPHTWVSEQDHDYASASYGEGYGPMRDRTVTHTRSILFIKPDVWMITDFLVPTDERRHAYDAMFHLDTIRAEVVGNRKSVETRNRSGGDLGIYGILPPETELNVISGQEEPIVQGWIPRGKPYECQPLPTAVFTTRQSGPTVMSYAVCPIAEGGFSPISYVERVAVTCDTTAVACDLALKNGQVIHFAQRRAGQHTMAFGGYTTDAEAVAIVASEKGVVERVIVVKGTSVALQGRTVVAGSAPVTGGSPTSPGPANPGGSTGEEGAGGGVSESSRESEIRPGQ